MKAIKKANSILIVFILFIANSALAQNEWKTLKNKSGIELLVNQNKVNNNNVYKIKIKAKQTIDNVLTQILNFDQYKNWVSNCNKSHTVTDNNAFILYQSFSAVFISDRDMYARATIDTLATNKYKIKIKAIPQYAPVQQKHIRIQNFECNYLLSEDQKGFTTIECVTYMDLAGALPSYIVNSFGENSIHNTFYQFSKLLENNTFSQK